jgi:hypothetical protein
MKKPARQRVAVEGGCLCYLRYLFGSAMGALLAVSNVQLLGCFIRSALVNKICCVLAAGVHRHRFSTEGCGALMCIHAVLQFCSQVPLCTDMIRVGTCETTWLGSASNTSRHRLLQSRLLTVIYA